LYVVYMCQKSLNFTYAFKCYQQNVSGFTLAGPPCIWQYDCFRFNACKDSHIHDKVTHTITETLSVPLYHCLQCSIHYTCILWKWIIKQEAQLMLTYPRDSSVGLRWK